MGLSHSYSRWDSGIAVIAWLCSTSAVSAWLCSTSLLETGIVVLGCECESPRRIIAFVVLLEVGIVVLLETGIVVSDCKSLGRIIALVMIL